MPMLYIYAYVIYISLYYIYIHKITIIIIIIYIYIYIYYVYIYDKITSHFPNLPLHCFNKVSLWNSAKLEPTGGGSDFSYKKRGLCVV